MVISKDLFKNTYILIVLLTMGFAVSGCSGTSQYQSEIRNATSGYLASMDAKYYLNKKKNNQLRNGKQHVFTVRQYFISAAQRDGNVQAILAELKKSKIDVDDALSHIWPRLDLNLTADVPMESSNDNKVDYIGGAYIKYDIWRAIAVNDEHALRLAFVNKQLQRLRLALNGLSKKILHQLALSSSLESELKKKEESLKIARQTDKIVKLYAQHNDADVSLVQLWQTKTTALEFDFKKTRQELKSVKHSISSLVGLPYAADITICDMNSVLSSYDTLPETVPPPSAIWSKHSEARLAEIDYIAAEINVKLAKMQGWPQIKTSVGLGNVPITQNGATTKSLFQVSVDFPLFDMGDNERKVEKARITRDLVKSQLKRDAADLFNRAQDAGFMFQAAKENYNDLNKSFSDMNKRMQEAQVLLKQNSLDAIQLAHTRLDVLNADIIRQDALAKVREAAGNFRFAVGEDVIQNIIPKTLEKLLNEPPDHIATIDSESENSGSVETSKNK